MTYPQTKKEWDDLLQLLPDYDPWRDAGECLFDYREAERRLFFLTNGCTFVEGRKAGQPLELLPWLQSFMANLFGWKKPDGLRRYRETMLYVPRGNSKTTTAAALVLCVMSLDNEASMQCYSAASTRDQARLCFNTVTRMIRNQKYLDNQYDIFQHHVTHGDSFYKALASEAGPVHGTSPHLVINDELHAHKSEELTETLITGTLKRVEPLVCHLTTADYDRESICNSKHVYACQVRDGKIDDPAFLPAIYEAGKDDPWDDAETWEKCNPNWDVMDHSYFERECERAKVDPAYQVTFKRLHLNLKTSANESAFDMSKWDMCEERRSVDECLGLPCFGALDVSSKKDLTAFSIVVPSYSESEDDTVTVESIDVFSWFWVPEGAVHRRSNEKSLYGTYNKWAAEGFLSVQPGERIEQTDIREQINILRDEGWDIRQIAYDPWNGESIRQQLEADDFDMIEFQQGLRNYSEPLKDVISLVTELKVRHGNHPVLRWCAGNCVTYTDANGNIRPDKKKSIDKIDGVVSMTMAHALAMQDKVEPEGGLLLL